MNQTVALRSASMAPGSNPIAAGEDAAATETLGSMETADSDGTDLAPDTQRHQTFLPLIER